jgi:lipopolysaccharide biosynthesis protein
VTAVVGVRSIAFYLPQFHPIPENDAWWGAGFTEWRNVVKGRPGFRGHYQPHLPGELGFYDLRLPEIRDQQACLAQAYGIDAFCYYHYWFHGRQLLDRPFREVLASGEPDHPFCLCWANESWSRAWDGRRGELLIEQRYSEADDRRHAEWLCQAFADSRYVRVDGKPLLLIYHASSLPDARRSTDILRRVAADNGIGDVFLCCVESSRPEHRDPSPLGFDGAVEFQPDWSAVRSGPVWTSVKVVRRLGLTVPVPAREVHDYRSFVEWMEEKKAPSYLRFPCVTPQWDNTARRPHKEAFVLRDATPDLYRRWVTHTVEGLRSRPEQHRLLFVNAWNEWAEGCHLEPCERWGRAYLEAHRQGVGAAEPVSA